MRWICRFLAALGFVLVVQAGWAGVLMLRQSQPPEDAFNGSARDSTGQAFPWW